MFSWIIEDITKKLYPINSIYEQEIKQGTHHG
jgi:hypothetical protein